MSVQYKRYEEITLQLQSIRMQINLRATEGNQEEVIRLIEKKDRLVHECDDLYCQLFMEKAG